MDIVYYSQLVYIAGSNLRVISRVEITMQAVEVTDSNVRSEIIIDDDPQEQSGTAKTTVNFMDSLTEMDLKMSGYEKRKYIANNVRFLSHADRREVGNMFVESGKKSCLKEGSDGCRVALDSITDEPFINRIMAFIKSKISK